MNPCPYCKKKLADDYEGKTCPRCFAALVSAPAPETPPEAAETPKKKEAAK